MSNEAVLKVKKSTHSRIKKLAKGSDTANMRSVTNAILDWALPKFESGEAKIQEVTVIDNEA